MDRRGWSRHDPSAGWQLSDPPRVGLLMQVDTFATAKAFLQASEPFLAAREAENAILYGVALRVAASGVDAFFAVARTASGPTCALVWTPPHRVLVASTGAEAADALGALLRSRALKPSGVLGTEVVARAFAGAVVGSRADRVVVDSRQRVYAAETVVCPSGVEGTLRRSRPEDLGLVASWVRAFNVEAGLGELTEDQARRSAEHRHREGELYVWDVAGQVVSMAATTRPTPRTIALNYVYTPDARRGRRYAQSCVATLTKALLDGGKQTVVLNADLSNAVSNRVYTNVGFEPVVDVLALDFQHPKS